MSLWNRRLWLAMLAWCGGATAQLSDVEWSEQVREALHALRQSDDAPPIDKSFYFGLHRAGGEIIPVGEYGDDGKWRLVWAPPGGAAPPDLFANQTWFFRDGESLVLRQLKQYQSGCGALFGYDALSVGQQRGLVFSRRLQLPHIYQLRRRNIDVNALLHEAGLQDRLGGDYVHHQRLGYIDASTGVFAVIYSHSATGGKLGVWEIHPRRGEELFSFNFC